jgi:Ran GTPase-activating protein (RanGAP) involved in mRNA processing and transport
MKHVANLLTRSVSSIRVASRNFPSPSPMRWLSTTSAHDNQLIVPDAPSAPTLHKPSLLESSLRHQAKSFVNETLAAHQLTAPTLQLAPEPAIDTSESDSFILSKLYKSAGSFEKQVEELVDKVFSHKQDLSLKKAAAEAINRVLGAGAVTVEHDGSFEKRVGNLVDEIFDYHKIFDFYIGKSVQQEAIRAINAVFGSDILSVEPIETPEILTKTLIENIQKKYVTEEDKLGAFLQEIQKLDNSLLSYRNLLKGYKNREYFNIIEKIKKNLIEIIGEKYEGEKDIFSAFLQEVQDENNGLLADNPLKFHKSRSSLTVNGLLSAEDAMLRVMGSWHVCPTDAVAPSFIDEVRKDPERVMLICFNKVGSKGEIKSPRIRDYLLGINQALWREGLEKIASYIQKDQSLTELNLEKTHLGDAGMKILARALRDHKSLTSVNLSRCELSEGGGRYFADAARTMPALREIHLNDNRIGGKAIAEIINATPNLEILWLHDTRIGREIADVAAALKATPALTELSISGNKLDDDRMQQVGGALAGRSGSSLRKLVISSNLCGDSGFQALQPILHTIEHLHAEHNCLGSESAKIIAGVIGNSGCKLTELELQYNMLGSTGGAAIGEALAGNSSLLTVSLSDNSIGAEGGVGIAQGLASNTSVENLVLWNNEFGAVGCEALNDVVSKRQGGKKININYNFGKKLNPDDYQPKHAEAETSACKFATMDLGLLLYEARDSGEDCKAILQEAIKRLHADKEYKPHNEDAYKRIYHESLHYNTDPRRAYSYKDEYAAALKVYMEAPRKITAEAQPVPDAAVGRNSCSRVRAIVDAGPSAARSNGGEGQSQHNR